MYKRILVLIFSVFLIFSASRALIRFLPGDPLDTLMAETGTNLAKNSLREELGLDQPFVKALVLDLKKALHGNLGQSILSHQPVAPLLWQRFLHTLHLTFFALLLGLSISLFLGLWYEHFDGFCTFYGSLTAALPTPWIGPMLIYLFSVKLDLFPLNGSVWLPALTLAIHFSGLWSRLIRDRVKETLRLNPAQAARGRGIAEWKIKLKYGLAPASGMLLAFLGTQIGSLLTGSFVVEIIFDWPGMGSLLIDSVLKRDYPLVEAAVFLGALFALTGNLLGDFAQNLIQNRRGSS